jgi:hypothetical protein
LFAIQLYRRSTMKKWGVLHLEGVGHLAPSVRLYKIGQLLYKNSLILANSRFFTEK